MCVCGAHLHTFYYCQYVYVLSYEYESTASIRVNHFDENHSQSAQDFAEAKQIDNAKDVVGHIEYTSFAYRCENGIDQTATLCKLLTGIRKLWNESL